MSEHYWTEIRSCLSTALKAQLSGEDMPKLEALSRLTLRPPKDTRWGDLCTNAGQLMRGGSSEACLLGQDLLLGQLRGLEAVKAAHLTDSGEINITLQEARLLQDVPKIITQGEAYGLAHLKDHCQPLTLDVPDQTRDLLALRQSWNVIYLKKLADLVGVQTSKSKWEPGEIQGYPTETALAKCGESRLRLALLGNGKDFAVHFSPVLAVDQTSDNPAFSIGYAQSRLATYLKDGVPLSDLEAGAALSSPLERELLICLTQWPQAIRMALRDRDMVNFVSFLQRLSLLFFRLNDQERLQSSDYLQDSEMGFLRLQVLGATKTLISKGLDLMDIEQPKEFI